MTSIGYIGARSYPSVMHVNMARARLCADLPQFSDSELVDSVRLMFGALNDAPEAGLPFRVVARHSFAHANQSCKMVTCPTTSHFCPCGLDICPPYLGFPLRRTDLPQILYHNMGRSSRPWKIVFLLSTCVVLSVSLQKIGEVQERFILPSYQI